MVLEPMVTVLRSAAIKLTIIAAITAFCFVSSGAIYAAVYYLVIPVTLQEVPLNFNMQNAADMQQKPSSMAFAPQPSLFCTLPIMSALTDYQRKATQAYRSSTGEIHEEVVIENATKQQEYFTSTSGPYTLNNGKLSQQTTAPEK